jgi:RTX calcium-binding nonapeptide repeat (4 copies)
MTRRTHALRASLLAALCIVCVVALDAAPAGATATRGFYIHNFTGATLKLDLVATRGREPVFEEPSSTAPAPPQVGDLLSPGEVMHVELYDQFSNTSEQLYRREADLSFTTFPPPKAGQPNRTFRVSLVTGDRYGPANQVEMRCFYDARTNQCPVDGTTAEMLDPPGTHITIPATDAPAQAAVLAAVCTQANEDTGGTCKFNPKKRENTTHPDEPVSDPVVNCTNKEIEVKEAAEHKVGTTNSVEVGNEFEVEVGFAEDHVKSSVHFTYGHEWIDEHKFSKEIPVPIEPGHKSWVDHGAPVVRFTGDFTLTVRNTTFTLTGVYFDHPDTGRTGTFYAQAEEATAAEKKNCKGSQKSVRLPRSDLTLRHAATAGPDVLRGGPETDVLRALGGNDVMSGGAGGDTLFGGAGGDLLVGSSGHDVLNGGSGADMIVDTRGPALVRTGTKTGRGWDYVYVRDGRPDDTVICSSRHTYVVADKGDRVRGRCGEVIRRGPIRRGRLPVG